MQFKILKTLILGNFPRWVSEHLERIRVIQILKYSFWLLKRKKNHVIEKSLWQDNPTYASRAESNIKGQPQESWDVSVTVQGVEFSQQACGPRFHIWASDESTTQASPRMQCGNIYAVNYYIMLEM